ncbi:MAG: phosphate transport system substrate-binding protein [Myxococcota bacterium]|jgi:phosphate transport system substrate-binding protein
MRLVIASLLVVATAVGCGEPELRAPGETRSVLRIQGSQTTTRALLPALGAAWEKQRPDVKVEIVGGGSSEGLRALLAGEVDLAATARLPLPIEVEQAKADGWDIESDSARVIIGVDGVAVYAHPSIPIDSLTYDQVIGIFCTRAINNWSEFGLDDAPIRVLTRDSRSGSRRTFEDFFCGPRGIHHKVEVADAEAIADTLLQDKWSISYASMSEAQGMVLGLRPDADGAPVHPTQQNIIRGTYPLYHDVYLFGRPGMKGLPGDFVAFIDSPAGQDIVDEQRFVPLFLRPGRLDDPRPLRETIHFEQGESRPNDRSTARLQLLVSELRERAGEYRHIVLEGYTDNLEPNAIPLSGERAEMVKGMLAAKLPGLYFEIIPRGAAKPIAPNDTPYGRQRNRRVAIFLAAEEVEQPPVAAPGADGG